MNPRAVPPGSSPVAVIVGAVGMYFLLVALPALALLFNGLSSGGESMVLWTFLGMFFGLPCALMTGFVAAHRERLLMGAAFSGRYLWLAGALVSFFLAHWVWMLPWTPVALIAAMLEEDSRFVGSALVGLMPWVLAVAALIGLGWVRMRLSQRLLQGEAAVWVLPPTPHVVWASVLSAMFSTPVMFMGVLMVQEAGDGGGLAVPALLTLGGAGLITGVAFAWSGAGAELVAPRRRGGAVPWRTGFLTYLGAFLLVQWSVVFLVTLAPGWEAAIGQRFGLQIAALLALGVGVGMLGRRLSGRDSHLA